MRETDVETVLEDAPPAGGSRKSGRGRYIPVRRGLIVQRVVEQADAADRPTLEALARRLALIFHVEFFEARERLKDLYVRFNPDQPGEGAIPADPDLRATFLREIDGALMAANFRRLTADDLVADRDSAGRVSAQVKIPDAVFDEVRFYGRGRRPREIEVGRWFGLKRRRVTTAVYDHVVFVASMFSDMSPSARDRGRLRAGALYLKLFRNIPQADLQTLFPNARVVMALQDKLVLGVPAIAGGIPILLNIGPALGVLFLVIGAYLGISGTIEEDASKQAIAALSGLGALGGFLARQWIKYERQKLKYQKQVAENAYFNNVTNNAGFFDMLIGASEDSEVKEAFLAYAHLHWSGAPQTQRELDARIEAWLAERFDVDVDFEIDDALAKLKRFGLVAVDETGRLAALAPPEALDRCNRVWTDLAAQSLA